MDRQQAITYMESIVFHRFQDLQELQAKLKELFEISVPLEQGYLDKAYYDNYLVGLIERDDLFIDIDIYYLKDNKDNYYITEVGYEFG
jgi:hypothetical protein